MHAYIYQPYPSSRLLHPESKSVVYRRHPERSRSSGEERDLARIALRPELNSILQLHRVDCVIPNVAALQAE